MKSSNVRTMNDANAVSGGVVMTGVTGLIASMIVLPVGVQAAGAQVRAFDPAGMEEAKRHLADVVYCDGPYHTMDGADAVILITEWDEFRALDFRRVKELLKSPIFVDLRNVYRPAAMAEQNFQYHSIGRGSADGDPRKHPRA